MKRSAGLTTKAAIKPIPWQFYASFWHRLFQAGIVSKGKAEAEMRRIEKALTGRNRVMGRVTRDGSCPPDHNEFAYGERTGCRPRRTGRGAKG